MDKQVDKKSNNRGFTLIEVMIVIIIIGMLSALVAPKFFKKIDKAKIKTTASQINLLGAALDDFRLDNGRYPTSEEGLIALREPIEELKNWDGPYLPKAVPSDAWGNAFVYVSPSEHGEYEIISYGRDGEEGGEDNDKDIVSWE
ncbi:MAG: type II secretion system protein GspG [Desulfobacteraceae bacterium 4572_19]|nr:MAG: type II secretion system protein GspG [Desulfobacteraceae bacterium 4572_19]